MREDFDRTITHLDGVIASLHRRRAIFVETRDLLFPLEGPSANGIK